MVTKITYAPQHVRRGVAPVWSVGQRHFSPIWNRSSPVSPFWGGYSAREQILEPQIHKSIPASAFEPC